MMCYKKLDYSQYDSTCNLMLLIEGNLAFCRFIECVTKDLVNLCGRISPEITEITCKSLIDDTVKIPKELEFNFEEVDWEFIADKWTYKEVQKKIVKINKSQKLAGEAK